MKSFLIKRRKSVNGPSPTPSSRQDLHNDVAPPLPIFARNQTGEKLDSPLEMPDLRFSKLDLEIDMSKIKANTDSRPNSVVQGEEKRKSKMAFIFSNSNNNHSKHSLTNEELTIPKLGKVPVRAASNPSLANSAVASSTVGSLMEGPPSIRASIPQQDRKKLVASATEAMNLDVPVKAPIKQQQVIHSSPLATNDDSIKSKKELKKEEKEKALWAKEQAKLAAKEAKEAIKKEKEVSRRTSKMELNKPQPISVLEKTSRARPEQRRALASATNVIESSKVASLPRGPPLSEKSSNRPQTDAKSTRSTSSTRQPPSAPPSHKPPPAPVSYQQSKTQSRSTTPTQSIRSSTTQSIRGGKGSIDATAKKRASQEKLEKSFQFPKQAPGSSSSTVVGGVPVSNRSQSALPATDGVPRPVVVRGQTIAPVRNSSSKPSNVYGAVGTFGTRLTESPPKQSTATFATAKSPSIQQTIRGSSSDEGGTSASAGAPSLDSNTSIEEDNLQDDDQNEQFVDARQTFAHRPRPRRDEERQERAQSRLSMAFDFEVARANEEGKHSRNESKDRFSALLMASRPGGAADRAADAAAAAAETESARARVETQRQKYLNDAKETFRPAPPPPQPVKRIREAAPTPRRQNIVRPELIAEGEGWKCKGVGDINVPNMHERFVTETILLAKPMEATIGNDKVNKGEEKAIEHEERLVKVRYNDLFELLWTSTTPDVISRMISHLDIPELKALRQTSHSIRFALNVHDNREMILNKYLSPIGYRSWTYTKATGRLAARSAPANLSRDPCPLSFEDCEAFLISQDLLPEYSAVGKEFAAHPEQMDPRMARLAQASTRAYSRVLTRLRLQPVFKIPSPTTATAKIPSHSSKFDNSSSGSSAAPNSLDIQAPIKHNSYYPIKPVSGTSESALRLDTRLSTPPSADGGMPFSPLISSPLSLTSSPTTMEVETMGTSEQVKLVCPWKPGRAAFYRVWVPASDPNGWLSDEELNQCESELYKAGIWNFMKKGDVVWDTAVGDRMNEGKYIFDGHYLRDLSYAHDVAGHLPSWLNCVLFSPSYWHNIILSSTARPTIYFDISPWKDQVLNSLRLVQDHVEGYSNTGNRYRIAKWLYRSAANIACGQIVSKMSSSLEIVDEGWNGRIVIETEGTAEHAKSLISRCAGPNATPQAKANLLAAVMGDAKAANRALLTNDTQGLVHSPFASGLSNKSSEVQNSAWMIMRERSRPGLIWIKLADDKA